MAVVLQCIQKPSAKEKRLPRTKKRKMTLIRPRRKSSKRRTRILLSLPPRRRLNQRPNRSQRQRQRQRQKQRPILKNQQKQTKEPHRPRPKRARNAVLGLGHGRGDPRTSKERSEQTSLQLPSLWWPAIPPKMTAPVLHQLYPCHLSFHPFHISPHYNGPNCSDPLRPPYRSRSCFIPAQHPRHRCCPRWKRSNEACLDPIARRVQRQHGEWHSRD